jgi:acetyl-CoA acetyltransferase
MRAVEVSGVGVTRFGKHLDLSLGDLAREALQEALGDARLTPEHVGSVIFANAAAGVLSGQEMIRGQVALKGTGLAGLPIVNAENACASGGTAAHLAWLSVAAGLTDVALAVGVEKLFHVDKQRSFDAIESGTDLSLSREGAGVVGGSVMMGAYAREAREYSADHGDVTDALAAIAVKNRDFATQNPCAQFRTPVTAADVAASRMVADPLRLLTCSPLTDGAAAIVFSAQGRIPLVEARPRVRVEQSALVSYRHGESAVRRVSEQALRAAGAAPSDVDIWQLHDACAFAELAQYEQVGIAGRGKAIDAVLSGRTSAGGDAPVNTDGGLLSRGHALGATGIAQLVELTLQLQGRADIRQVRSPRTGMAVNSGGWMGDDYAASVATLLMTDG